MRENKFILTVVRENGYVFSSPPFTLDDYESGMVNTWKKVNSAFTGTIYERQYIGLKINGREIYEGDVVNVKDNTLRVDYGKYKVMWSANLFGYILIDAEGDGDEFGVYKRKIGLRRDSYTVLGNIYENPELLNSNK